MRVSNHAIDRFRERVDANAHPKNVEKFLRAFVETGRATHKPRNWMKSVGYQPGVKFVYNASAPGICCVVSCFTVKTVLTKDLFRGK